MASGGSWCAPRFWRCAEAADANGPCGRGEACASRDEATGASNGATGVRPVRPSNARGILQLRECIEEENAVMRQRYLPRQGLLAAADHAHLGDGVMRGLERARRGDGGAPTRQASDARE